MERKSIIRIFLIPLLIVSVPLIAMQFTDEVNWQLSDFIIIGALLVGTGLIYELSIKKIKNIRYRIILTIVLLLVLVLAWMELAVGIFGTPFAGS